MKRVITYGTFDLFHAGHYRLLERAKELGDYLIVGVTTENYDESRGKLNVQEGLMERVENVRASGLADKIIIEEYEGQKINDVLKYNIDIFAIGSDWAGKFDYLKEYCEVVYLERTKGISSTQLRALNNGVVKLGIVGCGMIADKFIRESKFVSGVNIEGVFGYNLDSLKQFIIKHELGFFSLDYDEFLNRINAVYITSPHPTHYYYIKKALYKGKHVLCEPPITLSSKQSSELYTIAKKRACILLEAVKTAYIPGFVRLISAARSGLIGKIKNIDVTFNGSVQDDNYISNIIAAERNIMDEVTATKLTEYNIDSIETNAYGGSVTELASYPLFAIIKLLGENLEEVVFYSYYDNEKQMDIFTKINLKYKDAVATAKLGLGVESEGDLIISGTKGYIYVPSKWWETEYFEIRFESFSDNKKHYYKFLGDGLRYELAEYISMINRRETQTYKFTPSESVAISSITEQFMMGKGIKRI